MMLSDVRAFRGPNPYALVPLVQADLAPDAPPGRAEALRDLACELLRRAGHLAAWGRVVERANGRRRVLVAHDEERSGILAVKIAAELLEGSETDLERALEEVASERAESLPGPSTQSILDEAARRGIPFLKLDDHHYQLGHGARQHRVQATLTSRTSAIAVETADDKSRTKRLLREAGVPVPSGRVCASLDEALREADRLGFPVVVKPREGNHGRGVTVGVQDADELAAAFERARAVDRDVLVEKLLEGVDFRLLVIDHALVAAARRDPAQVVGDGVRSVASLVARENEDPRRGEGHAKPLTRIAIDEDTLRELAKQGISLDAVPAAGRVVRLKSTANLSTGGTSTDVTDDVHAEVRELAERVSRVVGLDVCGIDLVAPDVAHPLQGTGGGVCEVNAAPGFRMHLAPTHGRARNVAAPLVASLFPAGETGRIPIVAITGTNGKTTTTRLTAHILAHAGARVGLACTDGVEVRGHRALAGDYSGPGGAEAVLRDATVTHAVLEVARGGILRRGLGFDACDVGILLNIDNDHLGVDGVDTLDELAQVKGTIVAAVRPGGVAVLNAEDPRSLAASARCRGRVVLFALDADDPHVADHVARGGEAIVVHAGAIARRLGGGIAPIARLTDVPITIEGKAECNVRNALAATAAALALGLTPSEVAAGLATFYPTPAQLPGRLNLFERDGVKVLVDYGHNPPALRAIAATISGFAGGRRLVSASATGNRRDEDIREFGVWLANLYDEIYISDADPRGRREGETPILVLQGIRTAPEPPERVEILEDEVATIDAALASARPGDLVVLQAEDVALAIRMAERWAHVAKEDEHRSRAPLDVPA